MKVLLPIDGSVYSDRAIEYICEHSSLRAKTDTVYPVAYTHLTLPTTD